MKNQTPPESWEQEQFFRWVRANQVAIPELELCHASLNGVKLSPKLAEKMSRQGMRAGVPDIDLPVRRGEHTGLRIELKRVKGGRVSPDQLRFHTMLRHQGVRVEVCKGWVEAVDVIKNYLAIGGGQ